MHRITDQLVSMIFHSLPSHSKWVMTFRLMILWIRLNAAKI